VRSVVVALLICAVVAAGVYALQRRRAETESVAQPPAPVHAPRVVADDGCTSTPTIVFDLRTVAVGAPVSGKIGRHRACSGDDIEHMSGQVDWGDGTSSPLDTVAVGPKDEQMVVVGQHVYARAGRFALFARIRAQCVDHGQSTRIISCGSGFVDVR
jgi:hypothetical protein